MLKIKSDTKFTNQLHAMVTDKIQAAIWDLLIWLDTDSEIDSLYDLLRYVRLIAEYGSDNQGQLFFELVKDSKQLGHVSRDIADRYSKRGQDTGVTWLKELGDRIREIHENKAVAGR